MKQLKARVLLVEDDRGLRDLLAEELEEQQLQVKRAETAKEARFLLEEEDFDLIISDLRLLDADGLQLLKGTRLLDEPPSFIMITPFATVSRAVEALKAGKAGTDDFLTKPLDLDHFQLCVSRVLETHSLKRRLKRVDGNNRRAAGLLGISRTTIYRHLERRKRSSSGRNGGSVRDLE